MQKHSSSSPHAPPLGFGSELVCGGAARIRWGPIRAASHGVRVCLAWGIPQERGLAR